MSKSPDLGSIFAYAERCLERDAAIEEAGAAPKDALWEHQVAAIEAINATLGEGVKRIVLQVPTGGGKTKIAVELINEYLRQGKRVIFAVPRIDLIGQTVQALYRDGVAHVGVVQGKHHLTDDTAPVQVCSEQTLVRRNIPTVDIVFIDEVHLQFKKIHAWINSPKLQSIPVIGLSAAPWSKGLGKHYAKLIKPTSITYLIENGKLVPFTVFAPPGADLSQVRTIAGDFNEADLSLTCDTQKLVATS
jgi:DNA repair protein RadD